MSNMIEEIKNTARLHQEAAVGRIMTAVMENFRQRLNERLLHLADFCSAEGQESHIIREQLYQARLDEARLIKQLLFEASQAGVIGTIDNDTSDERLD
jgi:hypothetical protein